MQSVVRNAVRWVGGHDLALIVAVVISAAGVWGFAAIGDAVGEGESHDMDRRILLAMRDPGNANDPLGPGWFEEVARDVTALGGTTVLTFSTLAIAGYLLLKRAYGNALLLAIASLGAQLLSSLLKLGFGRPRPDLVPKLAEVYTLSFPSGHAMVSAAVYLTFAIQLASLHRNTTIRGYLLAMALMLITAIGLSRVYLGVHWPTDVLAGWTLGGAWALLIWAAARVYKGRHPQANVAT